METNDPPGLKISGTTDAPTARSTSLHCQFCGSALESTHASKSHTGAIHDEFRCPECGANGCLSVNCPGRRALRRSGTAFVGSIAREPTGTQNHL